MNIYLKGNYKSFIKLDAFKTKKKTNKVLINVHGLYAMSGDRGSKSKFLGNRILEKNIANVVQYSSSRDWNIFPSDGTYSKQQESFKGKTFEQEAQDLRDTIDLILDQSKYLFGIEKEKLRFYIVANSIGGTVTTTLKDKFKYIDKIVLAGSGTRPSDSTKPILSTCPTEKEILDSGTKFKGELLFLQGSLDDVVPIDAQNKLFTSYKHAKKEKVIVEGANHNFSKINGKDKRLAQKLYVDFIIKFLSK
jgi:hypothetical protein